MFSLQSRYFPSPSAMLYKHLALSKVQSTWERTMHPKWLQNKTRKTFQHKDLCRWGQNTKHKQMPCERLEEKLLWMCREKEPSPFLRLSRCSCRAALWLPALWISTPASLFITSTQSPYLPGTALDYREGTLSRETVKANEHRVNPVLQRRDTSGGAARGWVCSTSRCTFLSLFPLSLG